MTDRHDNRPRVTQGTSTVMRGAYESAGRLLVKHIAKIAIALGVAFVFVWDVRSEMAVAEQARIERLISIEQRLDVIEKFCCHFEYKAEN